MLVRWAEGHGLEGSSTAAACLSGWTEISTLDPYLLSAGAAAPSSSASASGSADGSMPALQEEWQSAANPEEARVARAEGIDLKASTTSYYSSARAAPPPDAPGSADASGSAGESASSQHPELDPNGGHLCLLD